MLWIFLIVLLVALVALLDLALANREVRQTVRADPGAETTKRH